MSTNTFQYPALVSRTLDPNGKSLRTIVALHDHQLTDADINLIQDNQDQKLKNVLNDMVTSGGLTYAPMQFNAFNPNSFFIPSFDVLFNGTVTSINGNQSPDLTLNRVTLPVPQPFPNPSDTFAPNPEDARLYVVFLEMWYQALNPITGTGYYIDPATSLRYFYPYGGLQPDPSNATLLSDDSTDPFQGLFTTERAQIQWRINVQRVALTYDFTKYMFGLDPGAHTYETVYAQASLNQTTPGISPLFGLSAYQFTNMGSINGDTGLWRAGDGNVNNSLGSMDGYSYAMPIAVAFQRNTGNFDIANNVFGCANPSFSGSGTLATRNSGRFDSKLADQIFPDDVVDTRSIVELQGVDIDESMRKGFGDLVLGHTTLALARGESPGNKTEALGSTLSYNVTMGPTAIPNTNTVGKWDNYSNGFSSDVRTFFSTIAFSTAQKSVGNTTTNPRWALNDAVTVTLPSFSQGLITSIAVTALVSDPVTQTKSPAALLQGQVAVTGLNSNAATVTFITDLQNTAFDPGVNNLYLTVGVTYPADSANLVKVPFQLDGGELQDAVLGLTLPVFGISEYVPFVTTPALEAQKLIVVNPEYSDIILGTQIQIAVAGSAGVQSTVGGSPITTFVIACANLDGALGGLYAIEAVDSITLSNKQISNVSMSAQTAAGIQCVVVLQEATDPTSTVLFSIMAQNTAQLAYNAPVKGVIQIEETALFGNYTTDSSFPQQPSFFPIDPRINIENISFNTTTQTHTIILGANGCTIKGLAGNEVIRYIWVRDNAGNLNSVPIQSVNFTNGVVTLTVGNSVTLTGAAAQPFLIVGSILPAFSSTSSLTVGLQYIPYQGEGVLNRDYEIIHSEDNALITTNGTGTAPIIGIKDIYPYNRELPIITMLPSQKGWLDSDLENTALATFFDSNYVAMRQNNVEHTFLAPLHTNDFIPPINKDTRKAVRFITAGQRGFATAIPHIGYAIAAPTPRTVLGQNLQSTIAPITLYVNNATGSDADDGLSTTTPKQTIGGALNVLPPVLRHPCTVILMTTGVPYSLVTLQSSIETIALGDGDIRSAKQYALANLSRVIHEEGRLVISNEAGAVNRVTIDATGFTGFGDGPTAAFYLDTSRVILNGLQFQGFTNPVIVAYNADIDMVNCAWINNVQAGAFTGCDSVILDSGSITLPDSGVGHICVQSNFTASNVNLIAAGTAPGVFYTATRNSVLNLQTHGISTLQETNIVGATVVAQAQLNSSIVTAQDFQSNGTAVLAANSVLARTVSITPFLGGVIADSTSAVVTTV